MLYDRNGDSYCEQKLYLGCKNCKICREQILNEINSISYSINEIERDIETYCYCCNAIGDEIEIEYIESKTDEIKLLELEISFLESLL